MRVVVHNMESKKEIPAPHVRLTSADFVSARAHVHAQLRCKRLVGSGTQQTDIFLMASLLSPHTRVFPGASFLLLPSGA